MSTRYAIMLGSNMLIGTSGVMIIEDNDKEKEFFRVREIHRVRSSGSYIVVDCDIKDPQGNREIKLAKSRPVATSKDISVKCTKEATTVERKDGSVIIKIELLNPDDQSFPKVGPPQLKPKIDEEISKLDAILRITGHFYAGSKSLMIDNEQMKIDDSIVANNLLIGTGGIKIRSNGISF